ncbi:hypothetical protein BAE44_0009323 [Dichanthelium oligosanthes]|uniref:Exosome complex component CSL4 n=1 Tax=Dichanthelium oligosanthes TaxID=888268 RepID=A0A1E5VX37_9POAL|nr:hypothetical protein BAE44_0009323 [Dichanthelium oligosanthes]
MAATAMDHDGGDVVTPGELLGNSLTLVAGRGAYAEGRSVRASVTGHPRIVPPAPGSDEQRSTVEVVGHKAHVAVPQPGSIVIARVTKVMARMASADIMCVDSKAVKEKFTGLIRQQDVRATEIDKVDMYQSYRPGDIVRAVVVSLGEKSIANNLCSLLLLPTLVVMVPSETRTSAVDC